MLLEPCLSATSCAWPHLPRPSSAGLFIVRWITPTHKGKASEMCIGDAIRFVVELPKMLSRRIQ
jgi:hypothetical protein